MLSLTISPVRGHGSRRMGSGLTRRMSWQAGGGVGPALAEELAIGLFEWDPRRNTMWWSRGLYLLTEREPEAFEPSLDAYLDLIHEEDREFVAVELMRALEQQQSFGFDHRIKVDTGVDRVFEVRGMVRHPRKSGPGRLYGIVRDVTEGRR